jgi:hypothetical protein
MANTKENLTRALQGLWRSRSNDPSQLPAGLKFSPFNYGLGNNEYQIASTDLRLNTSDPKQGAVTSDHADYPEGLISYSTVTVATERRAAQGFVIPYSVIEALQGENSFLDLADDAMKAVSNQLLDRFTLDFVAEVGAGFAAPAAGALDLSVLSTDAVAYFNSVVQEIEQAAGKRVTHAIMGKEAVMAMANLDSIANGPGIAVGSSAATERRLGYTSPDRVRSFFREMYGIELLVEDRTYLNAGTGAYTLGANMVIGNVDPRGGSMATFMKSPDIIDFNVRETAFPKVEGLVVTGDSHWKIEVTDPTAGRAIALTLP